MREDYTYLQQYAHRVLESGYNVFLTGGAGTGKTTVLEEYIAQRKSEGYEVMVLAPTGMGAIRVHGVTIHSQLEIGNDIVKGIILDRVVEEIGESDILIVEEISMCRVDLFDLLIQYIIEANIKRKRKGRKQIQLVLCGDFFQLPPVTTENDREVLEAKYGALVGNGYAFQSIYWNKLDLKVIMLTEIVRQDNAEFIQNLNKVREGRKEGLDYFKKASSPVEIPGAINLYAVNSDATKKNNLELSKLPGELLEIKANITGRAKASDTNAEDILRLKVGARVVSLVNKKGVGGEILYSNGSLGTVTDISSNSIGVLFDNGGHYQIERNVWEIKKYYTEEEMGIRLGEGIVEEKIGEVEQFPLKLAYAITIHKSQGQTYKAVNLSPYSWDAGQLYVALSRVEDIRNMYISYDVSTRDTVVSLRVIQFYNEIVKEANKDLDLTVNLIEKTQEKYEDEDMNKLLGSLMSL